MSPSGNLDWVWYGAGVVLALLGLALAYWSLLHDRARGRRRCPKCWYDMSAPGPDPLTCPECGRTAKREKKLFKTRRRWRWTCLSILILLPASVSSFAWPTVHDWDTGDWVDHLPITVLVALFQFCDGDAASGSFEDEVFDETTYWMASMVSRDTGMSDWQWHWAMWHCLNVLESHSDPVYSMARDQAWTWQPEYFYTMQQHVAFNVEYGLRSRIGQQSDLLGKILERFPPTVMPLYPPRKTWVIDETNRIYLEPIFAFKAKYPPFMFESSRTSGRLISPPPERAESWMLKEFGSDATPRKKWRWPKPGHYELVYEVEIEVLVKQDILPNRSEWVLIDTQHVQFEMDFVDDLALAYSSRQGREIDQTIIEGLHIIEGGDAKPGYEWIRIGLGAANNTFWHDSMTPVINVELLWNGKPAGKSHTGIMHPQDERRIGEFYFDFMLVKPEDEAEDALSNDLQFNQSLIDALLAAPELWMLHIWCDPPMDEWEIISWFGSTVRPHYWIGDIRIPLSDLDLTPLKQ